MFRRVYLEWRLPVIQVIDLIRPRVTRNLRATLRAKIGAEILAAEVGQ
jgi:hypothetical protein